ncbi:DeoR/GlpR family DNA-binding transcription regulator [Umezawaea tangerina]|uniref:Lactose phosphotransferase system repressor n=1 Tax=Umezawaea tangerina TaxID=84725 RepID=A0A2T0SQA5_9PSEU|nr:DeoR/GlpR family DNA-binding transcription regulator [Umezawaea tangerina]PRY35586.1 DeoR family transcriptional regulator [Umezawaea tangerina]
MKSFAEERQNRVLAELRDHGRVEVTELAAQLSVSEDTVRRDLKRLAEAGYLQKTHGGAVALDAAHLPWSTRADVRTAAKSAIGKTAASLITPGQSLFLDAGSTVLSVARQLTARPLTIMTNSLDIAALFTADDTITLSLTGGDWNPDSRHLTGPTALHTITTRRADWAVLGACATHPQAGITSTTPQDAQLKTQMSHSALRTMVVADRTKQNTIAPHLVLSPTEVDVLVTDDEHAATQWQEIGVEVLLTATAN